MLKKSHFICFFLFLICSSVAFSQEISPYYHILKKQDSTLENIGSYDEVYKELKSLYLNQLDTESYKRKARLRNKFFRKMNYKGDISEIALDPIPWIEKNYFVTTFTNIEEAKSEWEIYLTAQKEDRLENEKYYKLQVAALMKFGPKIIVSLMEDIVLYHPDKLKP
ncbi:hypothetical protein [Flavobacterium litorale]|uniref:Uncharacterized protein n=1 Tax=Flavobacterium litorale TaxID=2856519 RepID=A0ABX8V4D6_9FLAO|nr:hypothetical protein [Flavobacterium litorale]QYJ67699.1 hypothetical protein K1I41_09100 [Flavobacterium litorale]